MQSPLCTYYVQRQNGRPLRWCTTFSREQCKIPSPPPPHPPRDGVCTFLTPSRALVFPSGSFCGLIPVSAVACMRACVRQVHVLHADCGGEGGLLEGGFLPQQLRPRHASSAGIIQGMYDGEILLFIYLFCVHFCCLFYCCQPATVCAPRAFAHVDGVRCFRHVVVYVGGRGAGVMSTVL